MRMKKVHNKLFTCTYENGNLRYINYGDIEVIRMIYSAVRDQFWLTAVMRIHNESIEQTDSGFFISYEANYVLNDIDYKAKIEIDGRDDKIIFDFKGIAKVDFLKNRIGLCMHHPLKSCAGKTVEITHMDGEISNSEFPELISPHQPFLDVKSMSWDINENKKAIVTFEGDVFETEDQRNWTDSSFKTYSTPLSLPFPIKVKKGEKLNQRITLRIEENDSKLNSSTNKLCTSEYALETKYLFPKLGFCRSKTKLNDVEISQLNNLNFHHYRVECFFENNWQSELLLAIDEALKLGLQIELVICINEFFKSNFHVLLSIIKEYDIIEKILLISVDGNLPSEKDLDVYIPLFKKNIPNVKLGTGTNAFFAEINRNRPNDSNLDFISYSINPQVHQSDNLSIIENLEAQKDTIITARSFTNKQIQISPITLKWRDHPDELQTIDTRQHTKFIASWTALCLKHLAGANSLTFYEAIGSKGIVNGNTSNPLYEIFKKITSFSPEYIIVKEAKHPLEVDSLILEGQQGRMEIEVDWKELHG
jgi:D-apionolactonase